MQEYIIIGAGISGIYAGYNLHKKTSSFLILDKNDYIGGRALQINFHKNQVQLGAGIITYHNLHLFNLLNKLNIETGSFESEYKILSGKSHEEAQKWFNNIILKSKQIVNTLEEDMTCVDFFIKYFGQETLQEMLKYTEYTDYMHASVKEVFTHYPFGDLYLSKYKLYFIKKGWKQLLDTLSQDIKDKIKLNSEVTEIIREDNHYIIKTNNGEYKTKKIIFATDLNIKKIKCTNFNLPNIINKIGSMPFSRLYTHHEKHNINTNLINYRINRKIIPMGKNILMSAYADGFYAKKLDKYLESGDSGDKINKINKLISDFVENKYEVSPINNAEDYIYKYWEHGVHYLMPNNNFNSTYYHDSELNITICGEIISKPMGNVEACIKSIDDMVRDAVI
jgi:hypothetical protein